MANGEHRDITSEKQIFSYANVLAFAEFEVEIVLIKWMTNCSDW